MLTIGKRYRFAASHRLATLPETHKCHRVHGHNYLVTLTLATEWDDPETPTLEHGMLVDYGDIDTTFGAWLKEVLDHRDLNEVFAQPWVPRGWRQLASSPTAELLAGFIFQVAVGQFPTQVLSVRVQETEDTFAEVTR